MDGVWSTIIGSILSHIICDFLLHILNNKIWGIFKPIQKYLSKLTNKTRIILSFLGLLLMVSITVLLYVKLDISYFEAGLILGALQAIKGICLKTYTIENNSNCS